MTTSIRLPVALAVALVLGSSGSPAAPATANGPGSPGSTGGPAYEDAPSAAPIAWQTDAGTATSLPGDTLVTLARRLAVPLDGLSAANPRLDAAASLPPNTVLRVPDRPLPPAGSVDGIVINLPELRLYRVVDGEPVDVFPIGIGRAGDDTPLADTVVTRIDHRPSWRPPASIRREYLAAGRTLPAIVPPGPGNPLGDHALRLALPSYLLHGTDQPDGVGLRVSHGCIRLYDEHVASLARSIEPGTRVRIVNEPLKWSLDDGELAIEGYRPLTGEAYRGATPLTEALDAVRVALAVRALSVERFDRWLAARHADGALYGGLVLRLPVDALRPAG